MKNYFIKNKSYRCYKKLLRLKLGCILLFLSYSVIAQSNCTTEQVYKKGVENLKLLEKKVNTFLQPNDNNDVEKICATSTIFESCKVVMPTIYQTKKIDCIGLISDTQCRFVTDYYKDLSAFGVKSCKYESYYQQKALNKDTLTILFAEIQIKNNQSTKSWFSAVFLVKKDCQPIIHVINRPSPTEIEDIINTQKCNNNIKKIRKLKRDTALLNEELRTIKAERDNQIQKLNKKIASLQKDSIAYEDQLRQLRSDTIMLNKQIKRLDNRISKLEKKHSMLQKQHRTLNRELDIIFKEVNKNVKKISNEVRLLDINTDSLNTIHKRYNPDKALFIGISYNILPQSEVSRQISKGYKFSFLSKLKFAVYHHVGFFISNIKTAKNTPPQNHHNKIDAQLATQQLLVENLDFTALNYAYSDENLRTIDFGLNLRTPFKGLYTIIGVSMLSGNVWDNYEGNLSPILTPNENNLYPLDLRHFNNVTKPIVGFAYVRPILQVETGFNFLYNEPFIYVGFNFPLSSVKKGTNKLFQKLDYVNPSKRYIPDSLNLIDTVLTKVYNIEKEDALVNAIEKAEETIKKHNQQIDNLIDTSLAQNLDKEVKKRTEKEQEKKDLEDKVKLTKKEKAKLKKLEKEISTLNQIIENYQNATILRENKYDHKVKQNKIKQ